MVQAPIVRIEKIFLILILLLAAFFRFYRISDYMTFLGDEGRDALVLDGIATARHIPLIGPGTSVGSMYLGPLYYYLISPAYLLFGLSPVGPSAFVAGLGVATVGLLWYLARGWSRDRITPLIVAFLYAISPTVIVYSRSSWNPNVMPFFALLAVFGIYQYFRFRQAVWLLPVSVSLALVLNSHYLGLLLVPVVGIFWLLAGNQVPGWKKYSLLSLILFSVLMSPLVIFDMRHGWTNLGSLNTFLSVRETTVNFKIYKAIPELWPLWRNIVGDLFSLKDKLQSTLAALLMLSPFVFALFSPAFRRGNRYLAILGVWLAFGLIGLGLYKQHIYSHYYGFLYPAVFLALVPLLDWSFSGSRLRKLLGLSGISLLSLILMANSPLRFAPNSQLATTRKISSTIGVDSQGRPFNFALISKNNYDAGYRYFFQKQKSSYRTIHEDITDTLYVVCEKSNVNDACQPINNPLWEIASFGWAKIDKEWDYSPHITIYRLIHNPSGT